MHAVSAAPAAGAPDTTQTPSTSAAQPMAKPIPGLNELEDVLFDLHSSGGIDSSLSHDKLEAIQAFLHEHARERKTHEQFVAFFEKHTLPLQPERPNLLALPLVDARNRSARAPLLLTPAPEDPLLTELAIAREPAAVSSKGRPSALSWLWALGFGVVAGLLVLGIGAVVELRAELQQLRAEATHGALQLEQLRAETERLRLQTQDNGQVLSRTEHKTQLLLQTVAAPLSENSR
jgi:hypothetical protein